MVMMSIYVDSEVFCWIHNTVNGVFKYTENEFRKVRLNKTRKYKYELLVPIQSVSIIRNSIYVDLSELQNVMEERE